MMTQVPDEPIGLGFDPAKSVDPVFQEVFKDPVAWSVWLMIKATHRVCQHFNDWCLMVAKRIKEKKIVLARDLHQIIHPRVSFSPEAQFLSDKFEESETFLERLAKAITGERPIQYKIRE